MRRRGSVAAWIPPAETGVGVTAIAVREPGVDSGNCADLPAVNGRVTILALRQSAGATQAVGWVASPWCQKNENKAKLATCARTAGDAVKLSQWLVRVVGKG
ncbi:hypothetical protein GCM10017687_13260 [Streptomyces echinatus]